MGERFRGAGLETRRLFRFRLRFRLENERGPSSSYNVEVAQAYERKLGGSLCRVLSRTLPHLGKPGEVGALFSGSVSYS